MVYFNFMKAKMNCRLFTKQRLVILSIIMLTLLICLIYFKLQYIEDNYYEDAKSSCLSELTSTKYQLNVVTEYKNRIDKLLTETEKKHKAEKERFRDIMEACVAMKQQSVICQSQFEDLQSECKRVKEDYDKLKQDKARLS